MTWFCLRTNKRGKIFAPKYSTKFARKRKRNPLFLVQLYWRRAIVCNQVQNILFVCAQINEPKYSQPLEHYVIMNDFHLQQLGPNHNLGNTTSSTTAWRLPPLCGGPHLQPPTLPPPVWGVTPVFFKRHRHQKETCFVMVSPSKPHARWNAAPSIFLDLMSPRRTRCLDVAWRS